MRQSSIGRFPRFEKGFLRICRHSSASRVRSCVSIPVSIESNGESIRMILFGMNNSPANLIVRKSRGGRCQQKATVLHCNAGRSFGISRRRMNAGHYWLFSNYEEMASSRCEASIGDKSRGARNSSNDLTSSIGEMRGDPCSDRNSELSAKGMGSHSPTTRISPSHPL